MIVKNIAVDTIEIDMPISEDNVAQKMESFQANGMIQPLTLWKHGKALRVIDGFHRLEAAKRLGWTHVACVIQDCSEEAFWDARIQSAKQHADISEERLLHWIAECWKASNAAKTRGDALHEIASKLWDDNKVSFGGFSFMFGGTEPTTSDVDEWIKEKADRWGIEWGNVAHTILCLYRTDSYQLDKAARDMGYNLDQRMELEPLRAAQIGRWSPEPEEIVDYVQAGGEIHPNVFANHVISVREAVKRKERDTEAFQREQEYEKRERWLRDTPEGNEEAGWMMRNRIQYALRQSEQVLRENAWILRKVPDGPELVAQFGLLARDTIARLWPSAQQEQWEVPAVLEENVKLRRTLHTEHTLRIQAEAALLKGAERSKKLAEKLPDVIAWAGG